jgi:hypothetical protein
MADSNLRRNIVFVDFLSLSRQMPGQYLDQTMTASPNLPSNSQFAIHPTIGATWPDTHVVVHNNKDQTLTAPQHKNTSADTNEK